MLELNGRKVLVLGLGDSGLSMARWLHARGARVSVADTRTQPPHAAALARELPEITIVCGGFKASGLQVAELIAISPGVDRRTPELAAAIKRGTPVAGDVELFAQALPQMKSMPRVIAITGGKDTNTSPNLGRTYAESLAKRGVAAEFREAAGATHDMDSTLRSAVLDAVKTALARPSPPP